MVQAWETRSVGVAQGLADRLERRRVMLSAAGRKGPFACAFQDRVRAHKAFEIDSNQGPCRLLDVGRRLHGTGRRGPRAKGVVARVSGGLDGGGGREKERERIPQGVSARRGTGVRVPREERERERHGDNGGDRTGTDCTGKNESGAVGLKIAKRIAPQLGGRGARTKAKDEDRLPCRCCPCTALRHGECTQHNTFRLPRHRKAPLPHAHFCWLMTKQRRFGCLRLRSVAHALFSERAGTARAGMVLINRGRGGVWGKDLQLYQVQCHTIVLPAMHGSIHSTRIQSGTIRPWDVALRGNTTGRLVDVVLINKVLRAAMSVVVLTAQGRVGARERAKDRATRSHLVTDYIV